MKLFILRTDASRVGVADGTVAEECEGKLYPVGYMYASKKLSFAEATYPIIEKECLTVLWCIRCLKPYLAGKKFTLQNDRPLTSEIPKGCCLPE